MSNDIQADPDDGHCRQCGGVVGAPHQAEAEAYMALKSGAYACWCEEEVS